MQSNSLLVLLYKKLKENKVVLVYLPLVVYWIVLFILTTTPTDIIPQLFRAQDKLEHFAAYLVLAVLLSLTLHFQKKRVSLSRNLIIATLSLIMIYAAIDELHQIFVPGRIADIFDWMADSLGGAFGILAGHFFIKKGSV